MHAWCTSKWEVIGRPPASAWPLPYKLTRDKSQSNPASSLRSMAAAAAPPATGSSSSVEFIRARSDEREYRRVVLANALEVLVISDPDTDKVCRSVPVSGRPPFVRNALLTSLSPLC